MPTYPPLQAEPADETGWPVGFFGPSGPAAAAGASGRANASLHVTYRESHGAAWPHSGLMGASGLLAFETPSRENYAPGDLDGDKRRSEEVALKKLHYHELMLKGVLYSDSCPLERRPAL